MHDPKGESDAERFLKPPHYSKQVQVNGRTSSVKVRMFEESSVSATVADDDAAARGASSTKPLRVCLSALHSL